MLLIGSDNRKFFYEFSDLKTVFQIWIDFYAIENALKFYQ